MDIDWLEAGDDMDDSLIDDDNDNDNDTNDGGVERRLAALKLKGAYGQRERFIVPTWLWLPLGPGWTHRCLSVKRPLVSTAPGRRGLQDGIRLGVRMPRAAVILCNREPRNGQAWLAVRRTIGAINRCRFRLCCADVDPWPMVQGLPLGPRLAAIRTV
jgi:hypothetical protein